MEKWNQWNSSTPVDVQLNEQQRIYIEQAKKDRESRKNILPILFDVTNTISRLRLPFRGHDESPTSSNRGVFLEIVNLIGRWNEQLKAHLEKSERNPKAWPSYTSPTSQNEMIHSSAQLLREDIVKEIKDAVYFAICLDTTPDASKKDQLSMIIRFVKEEGDVIEALLDMSHAEHADGESLYNQLCSLLNKYDLSMSKLRGQGYDGCATMAGQYRGLQARVKEHCSEAHFVHCYAHRLNLVVVDTCSHNVTARNFFGVAQKLYDFIEHSTKRHGLFKEIQKDEQSKDDNDETVHHTGTLTSLSTTRWCSRSQNCTVLANNITAVARTLNDISTDAKYDSDTAGNAISLHNSMNFKFCLCLTVFVEILKLCDIASKSLQSSKIDISSAVSLVEALIAAIQSQRNQEKYDEYWDRAESMAASIGVEVIAPRRRKVSSRIDANSANQTCFDFKQECRVEFYYEVIDLMLNALQSRFSIELNPLLKSIQALESPSLQNLNSLLTLATFYPRDIPCSDTLKAEYQLFVHHLSSTQTAPNGVHNLYLYMVNNNQHKMLASLAKLYRLVLTLPVTSSSCERSFSALKFVENNLRTTMNQDRLNDLMVIAVEAARSQKLSLAACRDYFWESFAERRK